MERLRSAHAQSERTLESRERSHRQRIRGLEEQVGENNRSRRTFVQHSSIQHLAKNSGKYVELDIF